jgi:hypothetical protein
MGNCVSLKTHLQRGLDVGISEQPHDFDGDALAADESLPNVAERASRYLLPNLLQAGEREARGMQPRGAGKPKESFRQRRPRS